VASIPRLERPVEAGDERDLVDRARRGDRAAAESLLLRHELLIHRTCRQLLPSGEDVDAAVQETFLRALRGLSGFAGSSSLAGWMVAIAVNLCRDRLRRHRLVPFQPLESGDEGEPGGPVAVVAAPDPGPERVAMARQAVERVRREVAALPERQRETFVLRFQAGMDLDEIAAALGIDVGTVKTHLHRAVQRVRRAAEEAMP
jgi:RNA polymerase sigma-70 factor (ECF subfamily)